MHAMCTVELLVTVNNVIILRVAHNFFYSEFVSLSNNKTYVAFYINNPKYFFDFNQI